MIGLDEILGATWMVDVDDFSIAGLGADDPQHKKKSGASKYQANSADGLGWLFLLPCQHGTLQ